MIAHAKQYLIIDDFQRRGVPDIRFDGDRLMIRKYIFK
jgi:hypothetical protein